MERFPIKDIEGSNSEFAAAIDEMLVEADEIFEEAEERIICFAQAEREKNERHAAI